MTVLAVRVTDKDLSLTADRNLKAGRLRHCVSEQYLIHAGFLQIHPQGHRELVTHVRCRECHVLLSAVKAQRMKFQQVWLAEAK